ncbi:histidine ammonia-lyase [Paraburkholderia domus]|uniref:histidine ammonia-lyase n=1 Tax=Paraburkholderia domus TaxID=2793075 RepID=UPI00191302AA|nr:histidine ammonia-lyase [Paraburkholderia domus]MBK5185197.1 histidine ammonia-lyase [Burkholderia sp. R-69749]CAE6882395.1 Histidine ammonia-lyase [Paraburkholderia domus]
MIKLTPGKLTLAQLRRVARENVSIELDPDSFEAIDAAARTVAEIAERGVPAYGINTGFGRLASTHIPREQLELLQRNLVLSHSVGVGEPMTRPVVRLLIALKLSSLGRGHSGIRREVMGALISLFNADVLPVIPVKGSVGASGDLSPLAHMSAVLLGVGEVFAKGERMSAMDGLKLVGLAPLKLQAKEGLALLNGTQASAALALYSLFAIEDLYRTALVAGALSVDAAMGSVAPFDHRIHALRGHQGQIDAALAYRTLLEDSAINASHADCDKVQDPYSLRCQPQVMGACLDQIRHAAGVLLIEANAVSDNPLIFPDTGEVLSGGNFHAEPVAFAADNLAIAASEIGALAERRIALLIDATLSGLPPFLVKDGGVNSGFMIAHVTAAALASENKSLAHPASVDSLPTSANQEDHVSMATFAARRLADIAENVAHILAIELLAAAQGVELRSPYETSPTLQLVMRAIRREVAHYDTDRYFAPDIAAAASLVRSGEIGAHAPLSFTSEAAASFRGGLL